MPKSSPKKLAYQKAYNSQPEQLKLIAAHTRERRKAMKEGKVHKGDGKDLAHIVAAANGGSTTPKNLTIQSRSANRGWRKGESGYNPDAGKKK